jgi:hypothetical protein
VAEAVVDQSADGGHLGDLVADPRENRIYVRPELGVGLALGESSEIWCGFSHGSRG